MYYFLKSLNMNLFSSIILAFLSQTFTVTVQQGKKKTNSITTLSLPPNLQSLRHYSWNYCRELTSAHS